MRRRARRRREESGEEERRGGAGGAGGVRALAVFARRTPEVHVHTATVRLRVSVTTWMQLCRGGARESGSPGRGEKKHPPTIHPLVICTLMC